MRLTDVLMPDGVMDDLKARDKKELLREMASEVSSKLDGVDEEKLLDAIVERERLGTTGIGHGVAIPHGKIKGVAEIRVFFGRSRKGVDFNSMDKQPVYLFFLIIAPENAAAAHLKMLAGISHLLKNQDFRVSLMRASNSAEIYDIIAEADRKNLVS